MLYGTDRWSVKNSLPLVCVHVHVCEWENLKGREEREVKEREGGREGEGEGEEREKKKKRIR